MGSDNLEKLTKSHLKFFKESAFFIKKCHKPDKKGKILNFNRLIINSKQNF